jgi:hypothetical protein
VRNLTCRWTRILRSGQLHVRCMKPPSVDESPSLAGRIIGAGMAFSFTILTVLAIPMYLSWKFPLRGRHLFPALSGWALNAFLLWVGLVATVAMIIGFVQGAWCVLDTFNLIWRTGESNDVEAIEAATQLRKLILISICMPVLIFFVSRI